MITIINGIILTKKKGTFTNRETQISFDYQNIEIGTIDGDNGNIIKISCPLDIDISTLKLHKYYNLKVEIPTSFNERSKIRLVQILGESK